MASEKQSQSWPLVALEAWPPNDTEESILGTDLHQTTITNLRLGLNEAARVGIASGQPASWRALSQMALLGCKRPDGSAYRTYPDIFVYRGNVERNRGSMTIEVDGPPVLIVEVLSESTYEVDLDLVRGKGYSYARAGVSEYLTLDPTAQYLPEAIRAWRLVDGTYQPWEADSSGRHAGQYLPIAIALEGAMAAVYCGSEGRRMLLEGEIQEELARKDAELQRLRRLLDEKR
jgi:Putative restriction endonuclease